ncbi:MAG TPA: bifunctional 4-hydroxy-2-oxoglutarate aldolase/2-dehydro-3-deoxy-phosphogluconate aldolase [Actinomycetota bacterium]|nr:bifunctional 4-hydroxy-2-oxoglutarate aldolase/2-dehydro-3-deoxy-phosphogluconate aldolase [Actinomycetota bacterium]
MDVLEVIRKERVVAVIRSERVADPAGLAQTLVDAGIHCVEFTFSIGAVLDAITEAIAVQDAIIGAGTVLHRSHATDAIAAGAKFVVTPTLIPDVAATSREHGVPAILGGLSPTEVLAAHQAGAAAVKLFPANAGGPTYVRALRGPFPNIPLIASGGIDRSNAHAYLEAGAVAVNAIDVVAPPDLVASGNHDEIRRNADAFLAAIR